MLISIDRALFAPRLNLHSCFDEFVEHNSALDASLSSIESQRAIAIDVDEYCVELRGPKQLALQFLRYAGANDDEIASYAPELLE